MLAVTWTALGLLAAEMRAGFAALGARIDAQSVRLDGIEARIDGLSARIDVHVDRHAS